MKYAVIGDVHSSFRELQQLIEKIREKDGDANRKIVFVGDLFDRGDGASEMISWVLATNPISVRGNHDHKLWKALEGRKVKMSHGLDGTFKTMMEWTGAKDAEDLVVKSKPMKDYLDSLPYFMKLELPEKTAYVVHAAITPKMTEVMDHPDLPKKAREKYEATCIYGFTNGEKTPEGFPVRLPWDHNWDGKPDCLVIHGHTPSNKGPVVLGKNKNVINVDTGCCFGFELTSFLLPEEEFVTVKSKQVFQYNPTE